MPRSPLGRPLALPLLGLAALVPLVLQPGAQALSRRTSTNDQVLIVVNGNSSMSEAIGEYYRDQRNVPTSNVMAIDVPLNDPDLGDSADEGIGRTGFENRVRDPIASFLQDNGLVDQIRLIVLAKGVPLRIGGSNGDILARDSTKSSVSAELALLFSDLDGAAGIEGMTNPYFGSTQSFADFRAENPDAPLRYLVTRLDGYQEPVDSDTGIPEDVKQLIDGAKATEPAPERFLIDEDPAQPNAREPGNLAMLGPAAAVLEAAGHAVRHDTTRTFVSDADVLAGYVSWGSNDKNSPGAPYYGTIDGKLYPGTFGARAVTVDLVSSNARSFTYPPSYGQSLVADLIRLDAAGAAGHVFEPALLGVTRPEKLLRFYGQGVPAGEAYYRSVPYLGWMNTYVGDPLMTPILWQSASNDLDGDGFVDSDDNCIEIPNPGQGDANGDGFGDLCDGDVDNDGLVTTSWDAYDPNRIAFCPTSPDIEAVCRTIERGDFVDEHDLDGDGDVDRADLGLVEHRLFYPPGPSGLAP